MNITEIAQKIKNPNLCSPLDVEDFKNLIEKYPYAQTFPILLLKTLANAKDIHFEDALNKQAFRISDRMHLYYLINDTETVASEELNSRIEKEIKTEIKDNTTLWIEPTEFIEKDLQISTNPDAKIIRLDYEKLLNEDVKFQKVEEMTFEPVRIDIGTSEPFIADKIEENTISTEEKEEEVEDKFPGAPEIILEEIKMDESSLEENRSITFEFFDPTAEMEITEFVEDFTILKPSSFEEQRKVVSLDWIEKKFNPAFDEITSNAISQGFHVSLETEKIELQNLDIQSHKIESSASEIIEQFDENQSTQKRTFFDWLNANESNTVPIKNDRSINLIEKFIQEEPKITRSSKSEQSIEKKKTPFFKATEIAKDSLKENVIPVSETLAQIFEAQGNFPKAIHSYEQLMLLNPEKKTFFAIQIKQLKKKLNN